MALLGGPKAKPFQHNTTLWLAILSTSLFVLTAILSRLAIGLSSVTIENALALLQVLLSTTAAITTILVGSVLGALGWQLISRPSGSPLLTYLSLSQDTAFKGLAKLLFRRRSTKTARLWVVTRLCLALCTWTAGIVLFVNTSITAECTLSHSYPVTAGIGSFRPEYVAPLLARANLTVSYWVLATCTTLLSNPQFVSGVTQDTCAAGQECSSYVLPGGYATATPGAPNVNEDPLVVVRNAPAQQYNFAQVSNVDGLFQEDDCVAYGTEASEIGIIFCAASSNGAVGKVLTSISVCPEGIQGDSCRGSMPSLNMSVELQASNMRATTVASRSNTSLTSINPTSEAVPYTVEDIGALKDAMGWLLNYTASGLPASSSPLYMLWNRQGLSDSAWSIEAYRTLKNMLAFVLWFFSDNNFGNPALSDANSLTADETWSFLPDMYRTTASLCTPYVRLNVNQGMFALYIALELIPLLFCWAAIYWLWVMRDEFMETTSFPSIDLQIRTQLLGLDRLEGYLLRHGGDSAILSHARDVRIHQKRSIHVASDVILRTLELGRIETHASS